MLIKKNKVVTLDYTLKNSEGMLLDTSEGRESLLYLHGVGALIPGLEIELDGKKTGDILSVIVPPEKAYGSKSDDLYQKVSKDGFQGEEELSVGMQVQLDTDNGQVIALVSEINGDEVILDMNHPLADMELHFDVEIKNVREATSDEIAHGHAHGVGGHQH